MHILDLNISFLATCVHFLREQAKSLQLPISVYYPDLPTQPIVVITWQGIDNDLPSIVLNSHMDVVPVFESYWTHPPFGAEIDAEGRIFARGAQDMKCVGMQYLAAIRALKRDGIQLKRTIHVTFVPDEERGGYLGMAKFIETDAFQNLNIGFAFDEGIASPTETYSMFYGERTVWGMCNDLYLFHYSSAVSISISLSSSTVINIKCNGVSGHSSFLHKNTAVEKAQFLINKFMDYRNKEANKLEQNESLRIGDVTSINLTKINGGVQNNVVPPEISILFDIRIALDVDLNDLESKVRQIIPMIANQMGGMTKLSRHIILIENRTNSHIFRWT